MRFDVLVPAKQLTIQTDRAVPVQLPSNHASLTLGFTTCVRKRGWQSELSLH